MRRGKEVLRGWKASSKSDVFARTRNRLTFSYTGMLMLFLGLFVVIVFAVLFFVVAREQLTDMQDIVAQEVASYRLQLQHQTSPDQEDPRVVQVSRGQVFYYVVSPSGQVLAGDEAVPQLRHVILREVAGWKPGASDVRYVTIDLPHDHELHLLLAGRLISQNGQTVGTLYAGKDVTYLAHMFESLLYVLIGLIVLFLLIAAYAGHRMATRAMVPIMQSYQRQREFAADASHELRTPLAVLKSSLEALEMEEGEQLSPFSQQVLADMQDEVQSMTKLVGDLLTLARSESGAIDLRIEAFDLQAAMEHSVRSLQSMAGEKGVHLRVEGEATLTALADQERVKQLLYILLDNAIKYTPSGGEVVVQAARETNVRDRKKCLKIAVKDTGIGVPPEEQERIFDRFFRVDKHRSREMGGSGLGLAIAKWIVEAHRGSIEVHSETGQGTTFVVRIPQTLRTTEES